MRGVVPMKKDKKTVALSLNEICILCSAKLVRDHGLDKNFGFLLNNKKIESLSIPDNIPQVVHVQVDLDE
jgi:hypothetical protein